MRTFKLFTYFIYLIIIASIPLLATDWYVRPAGGDYGAKNGTSYNNAWDGLRSVVWGPNGVKPGDTLWVCGLHIYTMSNPLSSGGFATQADISPVSGTGESARVIIRGDYSGDPGIVWGAYKPTYYVWNSEGNGTYSVTLFGNHLTYGYYENITAGSWTILAKATSAANCVATAGSHYSAAYSNGSTLYIHLTDGSNPEGKVYFPRYGYNFQVSNSQYITFYKLKIYCHERFVDRGTANHLRWDGCTTAFLSFTFWDNQDYMEILNSEIAYTDNAIYNISDTNSAPSYYRYAGNTIHDIGVRAADQNGDSHGIGIQGGHDGIIEDNYLYNCGNTILLYAFKDQECKNNVVRRNFVKDSHTLGGTSGWGISTQCDNDSLSDKSGNKFYQNIVANCPVGFRFQFEDEQEAYNNVVYNCASGIATSRNYNDIGANVKLKNNIFYNNSSYHIYWVTTASTFMINSDCNLFYPTKGTPFHYVGTHQSLSQWSSNSKSGCVFDPNSSAANPLFIDPAYENFHLQSSSPAIDRGIDVNLTQDRDGVRIPQGFAPDIGAYECVKPLYLRINASPNSGQVPLSVSFSGNVRGDFPPFAYSWNFGDGQSSTAENPSHTYASHGNYTVTLTVTDSREQGDSVSVTINAYKNDYNYFSLSAITGDPAPGEGGMTNPSSGTHSYIQGSSVQVNAKVRRKFSTEQIIFGQRKVNYKKPLLNLICCFSMRIVL